MPPIATQQQASGRDNHPAIARIPAFSESPRRLVLGGRTNTTGRKPTVEGCSRYFFAWRFATTHHTGRGAHPYIAHAQPAHHPLSRPRLALPALPVTAFDGALRELARDLLATIARRTVSESPRRISAVAPAGSWCSTSIPSMAMAADLCQSGDIMGIAGDDPASV